MNKKNESHASGMSFMKLSEDYIKIVIFTYYIRGDHRGYHIFIALQILGVAAVAVAAVYS